MIYNQLKAKRTIKLLFDKELTDVKFTVNLQSNKHLIKYIFFLIFIIYL